MSEDEDVGKFEAVIVYSGPSGLTPEQLAEKQAEVEALIRAREMAMDDEDASLHLATEGRLVGHQAVTEHELAEIERLRRLAEVNERKIFGKKGPTK